MYPRTIPEVYELTTNDGIFLINAHPTTIQMARYFTKKAKQGFAPTDIRFSVRPITIPTANQVLESII